MKQKRPSTPLLPILVLLSALAISACRPSAESRYVVDVLNRFTPIKDQGESPTCWVYAMLAAIETEHIMRGDSVNLSAAFVEKQLDSCPAMPANHRATCLTLTHLIQHTGLVPFDAMPDTLTPLPRWAFMFGCQYTVQEFARSVCAPDEYVGLTSLPRQPYGQWVVLPHADNWEHAAYLNLPSDSLLATTRRAVMAGHGVGWESTDHAMSIVGLAHDQLGTSYFVMKNSWGTRQSDDGLVYVSFPHFLRHTAAVCMTRQAAGLQ